MPLAVEFKMLHFLVGFRRDHALPPLTGVSLEGKLEPDVIPDASEEVEKKRLDLRPNELQKQRQAHFQQQRLEVQRRWQPLQQLRDDAPTFAASSWCKAIGFQLPPPGPQQAMHSAPAPPPAASIESRGSTPTSAVTKTAVPRAWATTRTAATNAASISGGGDRRYDTEQYKTVGGSDDRYLMELQPAEREIAQKVS
ncbi:uncharacterized protein LTR77_001972 [Saxophila tyrrhenica]|uniref:Uncharacterized protein n=1 Tax=Saxophila tyrrhenica TaxID=1690608 RepID=A0AAV9PLS2_9PEZI|nr:hypothetical protein LTR77_001972 [Saxophila tyrrhenica]